MSHEENQKRFYEHLKAHPSAHRAAQAVVTKLEAKDPTAVAALKDLSVKAKSDASAANALRIIAVTAKFEHGGNIFAGGLPAVVKGAKGVLQLALTPAAWAL